MGAPGRQRDYTPSLRRSSAMPPVPPKCSSASSAAAARAALALILLGAAASAQQSPQPGAPARDTLPDGPQVFSSTAQKFRVVATKGLERPFSLAFLPDGNMLITERAGRLRIVRNGVLDSQPIAGIPPVLDSRLKGLQDIALHP